MTNYLAGIVQGTKTPGMQSHRSISEVRGGRGGRGRGGRGGQGGGGSRGHGRGQGNESLDQEVTRLAQQRIYREEWFQIPQWKQEKIKEKRKELKTQRDSEASLTSRVSELESLLTRATQSGSNEQPTQVPAAAPPQQINTDNNTGDSPSQLSQSGASMFGQGAHRKVGAILTSKQVNKIYDIRSAASASSQVEGRLKLDSHAGTTCAGPEAKIIDYTGQVCTVHGFSDSLNKLDDVPIVNRVTAYVDG